MGNCTSVSSRPPELAEIIAYRPSGPLPPASQRSVLMVWKFHPTSNPLDVRSAAVVPQSFSGFDANECYVLLHIYRRKEGPQAGGGAPRAAPVAAVATAAVAAVVVVVTEVVVVLVAVAGGGRGGGESRKCSRMPRVA